MKRTKKKVSIISRESDSKTLDIALLEAELRSRGIEVTVLSRLLTKDDPIKALGYIGHIARQEAAILASDVVVLDTYCIPASMLPRSKGTKVVQIWHSLCAIKKFGWQTVGMSDGTSDRTAKLMRMHRGYDYVAAPSDITAGHFCEAFDVPADKIVKLGLPRIDYIKSVACGERQADTAKRIQSGYPALRSPGRKIILYAPTFRRGAAVDVQSLIDAIEEQAPGKYSIVVKLHPLYRSSSAGEHAGMAGGGSGRSGEPYVIYDEDFPTIDWLSATDIVISDYSSLVVESTLADKPLYLYTYDMDEYSASTGLNVNFEEEPIAPYVFKDAAGLASAIDRGDYDMNALHMFRSRYIDIDTSHCTAALADFIEGMLYR